MAWRRTSAGTMRRGNMRRSTSGSSDARSRETLSNVYSLSSGSPLGQESNGRGLGRGSDPLHQPRLEAMRERRMVRIGADAELQLAAELRREIEREALLAFRVARTLGLERVALRRVLRGEVLQRSRKHHLHHAVPLPAPLHPHTPPHAPPGPQFHL